MRFAGLAVVLMLAAADSSRAQSGRPAAEPQARRPTERLRALEREADALAAQARTLLVDLSRLELQREIRVEEAQQAELLLKDTTAALQETATRLAALEARAESERPEVHARLVEIYKRGQHGYLRMLLGVEDLRSLRRAYRLVSAMAAIDRRSVVDHRDTLARLRQSRTELTAQLAAQTTAERDARLAREAADAAVAAQARLVADIDARRDLNAQLAGELQAADARIQHSIEQLASGAPVDAATAPPRLELVRGELDWPIAGTVVSQFRARGSGRARPLNGIEIGVANGLEVSAVDDGSVAYAETFPGFGRLVIVNHDNKSHSLYGYLSLLRVRRGDRVRRGQSLGVSGTSPTGTPAVYFELRIDGAPVDPLQWLERR
jgi:septal ring factor EnvC (AmiA/AmiB activator)